MILRAALGQCEAGQLIPNRSYHPVEVTRTAIRWPVKSSESRPTIPLSADDDPQKSSGRGSANRPLHRSVLARLLITLDVRLPKCYDFVSRSRYAFGNRLSWHENSALPHSYRAVGPAHFEPRQCTG